MSSQIQQDKNIRPQIFQTLSLQGLGALAILFCIVAPVFAQNSNVISEIRVIGNRRIPKETVLARLYSHVGDNYDPATVEMLRVRLRAGQSVLAAARGPGGPLAAGSYQLFDGVAEITGIGVLPASRRRGLGSAVTYALAEHARGRGAAVVFLSASDSSVARIYARLGFREIGTSMIAEPPD